MSWCSGYLNDVELVGFLQKARSHLTNKKVDENCPKPTSFIIIIENVNDYDKVKMEYGQRVRTEKMLEKLVENAGLRRFKTMKTQLLKKYNEVVMWALY